jgi:hypothetical protein
METIDSISSYKGLIDYETLGNANAFWNNPKQGINKAGILWLHFNRLEKYIL